MAKMIKAKVTFTVTGPAVVDGEAFTKEMIYDEISKWAQEEFGLTFGDFTKNPDGVFITATGPNGEHAEFHIEAEETEE